MKKSAAVLLLLATLPLAACGGSTETTNSVVTENVAGDPLGNELESGDAFGNLSEDNAVALNDTLLDNAASLEGNSLTATDNSQ
jgi:hypothetical protein